MTGKAVIERGPYVSATFEAPVVVEAPEPEVLTEALVVPAVYCAACITKLEQGLAHEPGVISARVNLTTKQVKVSWRAEDTSRDQLIDTIARLGFDAHPLASAGEAGDVVRAEKRQLMLAMAVAGFAMMNVMLLSVAVWSGAEDATRDMFHWLSAMIAMPTVAYSGRPFFKSAWAAVRRGGTNMDVPISIGVLLVTGLSLFETINHGEHAYFDGAVSLLFFLLVGRVLDSAMREKARDSVTLLLRQTAPGATVLDGDGQGQWLAATDLRPGMQMLVAAGDRLAADGVVEKGKSSIDRSLVTGESRPEPVSLGDEVLAGTINLDAPMTVRVTAAGEDTAIADIARLMEAAGQHRSRYVRLADKVAGYYAPVVHSLALISFISWIVVGAGWHHALMISAAVLIITCPCALGLAVPAAQVVASGALMRAGIIVKDGGALERLAEADVAFFDKTGTLTLGRPQPFGEWQLADDEAPYALALARSSKHPLSRAVTHMIEQKGIAAASVDTLVEYPGLGVEAFVGDERIRLGRPDWVGLPGSDSTQMQLAFRIGDRVLRRLSFTDRLRDDAEESIVRIKAAGLETAILSGDRGSAVRPVAQALGMTAAVSCSPADKVAAIERKAAAGHKVLIVGDGLNDGPALAAGHVSMAPCSATDVGQMAADFVFLGDSLKPVPQAVQAARRTMRVVRQNISIAIIYNICAIPLAIAGYVTPLVAALAMSGSSIIVVSNALRLRRATR